MNPGALDGLVVVDFSRVLAGPYATMMLGDFGAEVVMVEPPETTRPCQRICQAARSMAAGSTP